MDSTDPNLTSVKKALSELEAEMDDVKKRDDEVKKEEKVKSRIDFMGEFRRMR